METSCDVGKCGEYKKLMDYVWYDAIGHIKMRVIVYENG